MPTYPKRELCIGACLLLAGQTAVAQTDAYPDFDPRGRLHLDTAFHDDDDIPLADRVIVRRARLGVSGDLDPDWSFTLEVDFAEEDLSTQDAWLGRSLYGGNLAVGHFKVPMGLEQLTSSNDMLFIERASVSNVVAPQRRIGIGYDNYQAPLGYAVMGYGRAIGDDLDAGADMGLGIAGRVVFTPAILRNQLLHLGLSVAYEDQRDQDAIRFRERPEARPAGLRLIDTQLDAVASTLRVGVELAYQAGPFVAMAEYLSVDADRDAGGDPRFDGFHVQAGYVLSGEVRGYRGGRFRGVSPAGEGGAWEVVARYSRIDLNDGGFGGGEQDNLTLGVNWYLTDAIRFMANVIFVQIENSQAVVDVDGQQITVGDDDPRIGLLRAQYSF